MGNKNSTSVIKKPEEITKKTPDRIRAGKIDQIDTNVFFNADLSAQPIYRSMLEWTRKNTEWIKNLSEKKKVQMISKLNCKQFDRYLTLLEEYNKKGVFASSYFFLAYKKYNDKKSPEKMVKWLGKEHINAQTIEKSLVEIRKQASNFIDADQKTILFACEVSEAASHDIIGVQNIMPIETSKANWKDSVALELKELTNEYSYARFELLRLYTMYAKYDRKRMYNNLSKKICNAIKEELKAEIVVAAGSEAEWMVLKKVAQKTDLNTLRVVNDYGNKISDKIIKKIGLDKRYKPIAYAVVRDGGAQSARWSVARHLAQLGDQEGIKVYYNNIGGNRINEITTVLSTIAHSYQQEQLFSWLVKQAINRDITFFAQDVAPNVLVAALREYNNINDAILTKVLRGVLKRSDCAAVLTVITDVFDFKQEHYARAINKLNDVAYPGVEWLKDNLPQSTIAILEL